VCMCACNVGSVYERGDAHMCFGAKWWSGRVSLPEAGDNIKYYIC